MSDEPQVQRASETASDVAHAYDRWSRRYDDDRNATRDLDAQVVRETPLGVAGAASAFWGLIAGMLAVARRRVASPTARFLEHDITRAWPVDDGAVDVVVGNLVLEHVRDLAPIYAEAARVLAPAGRLFLCELHPYRQLRGGQAHFVDVETNEIVPVTAFQHTVSEYVTGALDAGFTLRALGEWLEDDAPTEAPPRLLSLLFERG